MKLKSVAFPNYVPAPAKGGSFNMVKSLEASHANLGKLYDLDLKDGAVTIRSVGSDGKLSRKYTCVPLTSISYWLGEDAPEEAAVPAAPAPLEPSAVELVVAVAPAKSKRVKA